MKILWQSSHFPYKSAFNMFFTLPILDDKKSDPSGEKNHKNKSLPYNRWDQRTPNSTSTTGEDPTVNPTLKLRLLMLCEAVPVSAFFALKGWKLHVSLERSPNTLKSLQQFPQHLKERLKLLEFVLNPTNLGIQSREMIVLIWLV